MLVVDFIQNLRMRSKVETNATRLLLKDGGYYLTCKSSPDRRVLSDSILGIECTRILITQYAETCLENLILHVKFDCHVMNTVRDNDMINLKQRGSYITEL